uniref:Putative ovule protein n=1 Tax=Solanum chacoense TaxID=4108 RepID=A0A0V0GTC2_SOLCH
MLPVLESQVFLPVRCELEPSLVHFLKLILVCCIEDYTYSNQKAHKSDKWCFLECWLEDYRGATVRSPA